MKLHPSPLTVGLALLPLAALAADPSGVDENNPDQTVRMEAFQVSTSIGTYHEETSSMATKVPTDLRELASSLQILNANAIADRKATNITDLYPYIIGLAQVSNIALGFTFRGFGNGGGNAPGTNLQTDGLPGILVNKIGNNTSDVESIEFLKGPNGVLYGFMQPGGLMNIVTKSPKSVQSAEVKVSFATFAGRYNTFGDRNSYRGSIDVTGPIDQAKRFLYRLVAEVENRKPFRPLDYARGFSIYPSFTYQASPETHFTVKFEVVQFLQHPDTGLWAPFLGRDLLYLPAYNTVYSEATDTERERGTSASTFFTTRFADLWTYRFTTRSVYHYDASHTLTNAAGVIKVGNPPQTSTLQRQFLNNVGPDLIHTFDTNAYAPLGPDGFKNTVLIGLTGSREYNHSRRFSQSPVAPIALFNPVLGVTAYPPDGIKGVNSPITDFNSYAGYVVDQMRIAERLHVTAGLRYTYVNESVADPVLVTYASQVAHSVSKQLGFVYDLTKVLSAYVAWSESFTPNNPGRTDTTGRMGGFAPEKGTQYEGGLKFETLDHTFYAAADVYEIKRTNILATTGLLTPQGVAIFRFDGENTSKGLELETQWQPLANWQIQAGMSEMNAYISKSTLNPQIVGSPLDNAPHTTANLWTRYNFASAPLKGFGVALGAIYTGRMWGGDPTNPPSYFRLSGWTRWDTALYYKWKGGDVAMNVKNVFDRKYIQSIQTDSRQIYPGDPRKFTFEVTQRF